MSRLLRRPLGVLGVLMILIGVLAVACGGDDVEPDQVHVLTWEGIVNPVMERYIDRGIDGAEESDARAVVMRLDTPGGLDSSMRKIIQRIQSSRVPVIVFVAPAGGRAASAGTFITMAGHVAAMAPSTTIGAATPINSSGEDIEGALGRKVTNDSVAYIRGIAEQRGRNADWAEDAVRNAVAVNETEAVNLNVVDFVANGLDHLLQQSDGREALVATDAGATTTVTIRTAAAPIHEENTTILEQLLYVIADPNIAFLLLSLGGLALVIEIISPGFGIGIFGVIAIILAFFALGSLPTNWAGVALIVLGLTLLLAEVFVTGFGVFGVGGIAAMIFGGLILSGSNDTPEFQVSRWLVIGFGVIAGAFVLALARALMQMRRMPAHSGRESLIGAKGTTRSRLDPKGVVWVAGETWKATAEDPPIEEDAPVIITRTEGLRLRVKRDPASIKLLPAANVTSDSV
ncbi:MAG: nodulation protein NfeD [Dehalococcoidia bacterium]|nr:nodulation protein NfeD [Dehalococcoidia bacterium]